MNVGHSSFKTELAWSLGGCPCPAQTALDVTGRWGHWKWGLCREEDDVAGGEPRDSCATACGAPLFHSQIL